MHARALIGLIVAAGLGCAGTRASSGFHEVPQGLVHVVFTEVDVAPLEELSGREAVKLREKVAAEHRRTYLDEGHVAWFFHGFDEEQLYFFVARWEPGDIVGGTYHVLTRYEVRRTRRVERALGVADDIAEYERGAGGLRAGMSQQEVEAARGVPERVIQLGPWGAFDYVYKDICVRFLEGRAAHLWEPSRCAPADTPGGEAR